MLINQQHRKRPNMLGPRQPRLLQIRLPAFGKLAIVLVFQPCVRSPGMIRVPVHTCMDHPGDPRIDDALSARRRAAVSRTRFQSDVNRGPFHCLRTLMMEGSCQRFSFGMWQPGSPKPVTVAAYEMPKSFAHLSSYDTHRGAATSISLAKHCSGVSVTVAANEPRGALPSGRFIANGVNHRIIPVPPAQRPLRKTSTCRCECLSCAVQVPCGLLSFCLGKGGVHRGASHADDSRTRGFHPS